MKKFAFSLLIFLAAPKLWAYNIDLQKISVSGISSGAYMAGQMHIAYSSTFMGVGIVAGGPYYCSRGDLPTALNSCMDVYLGTPDTTRLIDITLDFANKKLIDNPSQVKNSQVYILTGKNDRTVVRPVVDKAVEFYRKLGVPTASLKFVDQLNVGHAFPTDNYGNSCATASDSPWISNCNYDAAGDLLKHIYGNLNTKTTANSKNFFIFSQTPYTQNDPAKISMANKAIAYIPTACQNNESCTLHVVFHGCRQTLEEMGDTFYKNAGYAEWAEANKMLLLFPQAAPSDFIMGNPKGCWDWWGYTGSAFATQQGPQMRAVYKMLQDFSNPSFKLISRIRRN